MQWLLAVLFAIWSRSTGKVSAAAWYVGHVLTTVLPDRFTKPLTATEVHQIKMLKPALHKLYTRGILSEGEVAREWRKAA